MRLDLLPVIVALVGGIAIGVQIPIYGLIGSRSSPMGAAFTAHAGGMLVAMLVLAALALFGSASSPRDWGLGAADAPPARMALLALSAGIMGVTVISSLGFAVTRLGVAAASVISVSSQLLTGLLLDHVGVLGLTQRPLEWSRAGGALLLLAGAWLILRR